MNQLKHIVISGGGPLFIYGFGVFRELVKRRRLSIESIESIHGTSSGSIIAFLLASKLDMNNVCDYLTNFPYNKYFSLKIDTMFRLNSKQGVFNKNQIDFFIDPLLKTLNWDLDICLADVNLKTGINLHIYSSNLNTFDIIDFNHIDYPYITLKDAIYASCAHPILFEPHYLCLTKEDTTKTCLIDGGLFCNVPLGACIERYYEKDFNKFQFTEHDGSKDKLDNCKNEIFCLHYAKYDQKLMLYENDSFIKYIKILLVKMILGSEKHTLANLLPFINNNFAITLNGDELDWNLLLKDITMRERAMGEVSKNQVSAFLKKRGDNEIYSDIT